MHQIWKRKPGTHKEDLTANRYIHCREWLPKTAESLVVRAMDKQIKASRFQIGGVAGHRPQEHIFSIYSLISKYNIEKKLIVLICYDISGVSSIRKFSVTLCRSCIVSTWTPKCAGSSTSLTSPPESE